MIIRSSWWKVKYFIWNNIVSPYAWSAFLVLQPTNTSHFSDQIHAQKWLHQYIQLLRLHGAVCIYPMREHAKEQQLLPMFSSHSHNSNCQHRIHLYYYISLQFKRENSFLGKKHRPSAGTDTLSSPGSTSITSLKYLDLWIQAYLSTAAQKQQQVLLCAGWHYFLLFCILEKSPTTTAHSPRQKQTNPLLTVSMYRSGCCKKIQEGRSWKWWNDNKKEISFRRLL